MKLTIELLSKKDMEFEIMEDYDNEGHNHSHHVSGFWKTLWDIFMLSIHFMKEVKKRIREEK